MGDMVDLYDHLDDLCWEVALSTSILLVVYQLGLQHVIAGFSREPVPYSMSL